MLFEKTNEDWTTSWKVPYRKATPARAPCFCVLSLVNKTIVSHAVIWMASAQGYVFDFLSVVHAVCRQSRNRNYRLPFPATFIKLNSMANFKFFCFKNDNCFTFTKVSNIFSAHLVCLNNYIFSQQACELWMKILACWIVLRAKTSFLSKKY